jgi:hypothetical protein
MGAGSEEDASGISFAQIDISIRQNATELDDHG